MNKLLFTVFALLLLHFGGVVVAQRPVSSALQDRKVVLEQFTGIHCASCPNGHRIADSLKAVKPAGSVFVVNLHMGTPAIPNSGEPDFRFGSGFTFGIFPGIGGATFPSATVNRQKIAPNSSTILSPSQWSAAIDSVQSEISPYNLALDATLNVATGNMHVTIDYYRQSFDPLSTSIIQCIYLLEDGVLGPQLGSPLYPTQVDTVSGLYRQNNLLRKDMTNPTAS